MVLILILWVHRAGSSDSYTFVKKSEVMKQVRYGPIASVLGHYDRIKPYHSSPTEKSMSANMAVTSNSNNNGQKNGRRGNNMPPEEFPGMKSRFPFH